MKRNFLLLVALSWPCLAIPDETPYRVRPYLQNPQPQSISVVWVSLTPAAGTVRCWEGSRLVAERESHPKPASQLGYEEWESQTFFGGNPPPHGWLQEVQIGGLQPGHRYHYEVEQCGQTVQAEFHTPPQGRKAVHFVAYADCETEPESSGARVNWDPPQSKEKRPYLVDQTDGYAAHLRLIGEEKPDFVVIAGDIVESGGEQRDWDEFWKQTGPLAASIPILGCLGNHDYFGGPKNGQYQTPASEKAVAKFLSYFRWPDNGAPDPQKGRYGRVDYGPVTIIALDANNGLPQGSHQDSNHYLREDSPAPDYHPGSPQYRWLEAQLEQAHAQHQWIFVAFHQCPYSSGIHTGPEDPLCSLPLRCLTPLFLKYQVDALLCGHDEMMERSEVRGEGHILQVYDVGVGGDGLRGPERENPYSKFLAHRDSPEQWKDGILIDGGKHYGHLEVKVVPQADGWEATLTPVYNFPVCDREGRVVRWERRIYPDVVRLHKPY